MNQDRTIFAQLMDFVPQHVFRQAVKHYKGNHRVKSFTCWQQYLCMAFAQLTGRESLRDIESCLRSLGSRVYHAGITAKVHRSTLADANETRPWQIYQELACALIERARKLYHDQSVLSDTFDSAIYAFDATIIELCLGLFPWAYGHNYRDTRAGVKMHTLFDVRAQVPAMLHVTAANVGDVTMLDVLVIESGAFYIIDRGYTDFVRLRRIDQHGAFFVIRARDNLRLRRLYSNPVDKSIGVQADQVAVFDVPLSHQKYPDHIRRIRYFDQKQNRTFIFLTNNFVLDARTVAELYRLRWQVELFFRWIKQHLRIKTFYGTSLNAVKTQIWIATSVYVLIAIVKKELQLNEHSLYEMLQILSITLFEKEPLNQVFTKSPLQLLNQHPANQLLLFDF